MRNYASFRGNWPVVPDGFESLRSLHFFVPLPLIKDKALAGTPGLSNIHQYLAEGWQTLVF